MCDIFQFLTVPSQVLVFKVSCLFTASWRTNKKTEGKEQYAYILKRNEVTIACVTCCLILLITF